MILNKGLWIYISLDGLPASISRTLTDETILTVYGTERVAGVRSSTYHPFGPEGLPSAEDHSAFAELYRKLEVFVKNEGLKGPYGEDHPAFFNRFEYVREGSPQELLTLLEKVGVIVRVVEMDHRGDDAEVEQAKTDFGRWIHDDTVFRPNPKVVKAKERERQEEEWQVRREKADRWDRKFRLFVLFPLLTAILGGAIWGAFLLHWVAGLIAVLFIGFAWWWIRH